MIGGKRTDADGVAIGLMSVFLMTAVEMAALPRVSAIVSPFEPRNSFVNAIPLTTHALRAERNRFISAMSYLVEVIQSAR